MRYLTARYRAWVLRQAAAQCNPGVIALAICLLLSGPAYLYVHHHWAGFMAALEGFAAGWLMISAACLLVLTARYIAAAGQPEAPGQGTHAFSKNGWTAQATPEDAAMMAAEAEVLAADTVTLMMSERGGIFALDESPDGEEADL
jgi:hypothetical protein